MDSEHIIIKASGSNRGGMAHLASVAISDKDRRQVLHEIVRKPEESKVLKSYRKWCPITEDQFVCTRMSEVFGVEAVRQMVLK